jgi:hypothetical protein
MTDAIRTRAEFRNCFVSGRAFIRDESPQKSGQGFDLWEMLSLSLNGGYGSVYICLWERLYPGSLNPCATILSDAWRVLCAKRSRSDLDLES